MSVLKWFFVAILCLLLYAGAGLAGVFVAVDRTLGSSEFVSGFIQRQNLGEVAAVAQRSASEGNAPSQLALVGKLGFSIFEPEFKRQSRSMLDEVYAYLKGKKNELRLVMDLRTFKQDPAVLKTAVDGMMRHETVARLPRVMVEPGVKLLLQKVPGELNFTSLATAGDKDFVETRKFVGNFYTAYNLIFGICIVMIVLIALSLRNLRQTLLTLGIILLLAGLTLFLPWFASESIAKNILSNFSGVGGTAIQSLGAVFFRNAFAVFVLSPIALSLMGLAGLLAGRYAGKDQPK